MKQTQAVGIDLGTTYSCIAWLNEHGHPVTIPNQEGELATPSVVFFDDHEPIVGTEALRNAIARPERVVQNAKRHMGDSDKFWRIGANRYNPVQISGLILRKLIAAAQDQIGEINEAVVTVPAQFSDAQRHATVTAGHSAGLEKVEIINEPVAAALCHVLGNEGLAFTELAIDQQLLVYDLGGGTLDLAIVSYSSDQVRVVASDGDLELGGLDWTQVLVDIAADRFLDDFKEDPRQDPHSHQFLALEAEQAKRSLSVRPRAAVTVQHEGNRRTYQIEQEEFEHLGRALLKRSNVITRRILADNGFGWAHVDVVLTTGGSSRMPMVRESLKKLSGRTLNSSLSPDQSIAHGAAYYSGMLLANQEYTRTIFDSQASSRLAHIQQQSVNARGLGILIRDTQTGDRVPHYLIPPNTALPASHTHVFGTVVDQQTKVHIRIVESGAGPGKPHTILGDCLITDLPSNLPEGSEVEVMISYDAQARVHVSARELKSGRSAETEIIRQENMAGQLQQEVDDVTHAAPPAKKVEAPQPAKAASQRKVETPPPTSSTSPKTTLSDEWAAVSARLSELSKFADSVDQAEQPVLLCNSCGTALGPKGKCSACDAAPKKRKRPTGVKRKSVQRTSASKPGAAGTAPAKRKRKKTAKTEAAGKSTNKQRSSEDDFWDLVD
ncbi:MAG: Hsp70 family protein [Fuerstiella sp.]|nr:Hsp70 family protein [Fuerstiella sp.]MCP4857049.1 Hsp70 family protein [Fuerstiella sp.]